MLESPVLVVLAGILLESLLLVALLEILEISEVLGELKE